MADCYHEIQMIGIIGGGLAGLSAAWELQAHGVKDFVLLEAAERLGGVVRTMEREGLLLEGGPESFLARKPAALDLCRELGLEGELIAPATTSARILHRRRLRPIPAGWRMLEPGRLGPVLRSPLLGTRAKLDIWRHWRRRQDSIGADESIASCLGRRYGRRGGNEIAVRIAGPLLTGVFGGNADDLSWLALAPPSAVEPAQPPSRPVFMSLRGGMGTLVKALEAALPAQNLRRGQRATAAIPNGGGFRLVTQGGEFNLEAMILALPAWAAAELLGGLDRELAETLAAIPYASSVNLNLAFDPAPPMPPGSGFLVPRGEGLRLVACTFAHQKWAGRAPQGAGLVRLFYSEEEAGLDDESLTELGLRELKQIVPLSQTPRFVQVTRSARAMPHYVVGHHARVQAIGRQLQRHPRLALAGNALEGVGVPDCIASGRAAARRVLAPAAVEAR